MSIGACEMVIFVPPPHPTPHLLVVHAPEVLALAALLRGKDHAEPEAKKTRQRALLRQRRHRQRSIVVQRIGNHHHQRVLHTVSIVVQWAIVVHRGIVVQRVGNHHHQRVLCTIASWQVWGERGVGRGIKRSRGGKRPRGAHHCGTSHLNIRAIITLQPPTSEPSEQSHPRGQWRREASGVLSTLKGFNHRQRGAPLPSRPPARPCPLSPLPSQPMHRGSIPSCHGPLSPLLSRPAQ